MKKMCPHSKNSKHIGLLALRISVGFIFIMMGWGKLTGIEGVVGMLSSLGFPAVGFFAYLLGIVEFIGGFAILFGVYTQVVAGILAVVMVVALLTAHRGQPLQGAFLAISMLGSTLALWGTGAGKYRILQSKSECACGTKHSA